MNYNRVLIIAGTHERENEFSHAVADRLVQEYGAKEPDYTFLGVDKAREGKLWLYDQVAVAKIDKIGETSKEYLETLPIDCLTVLAYLKVDHEGLEFPPSIDSCFGNVNPQWTSVTQPMIDASDAGFYIDLHSYHAYSQLDGTGVYILSHAKKDSPSRIRIQKSLGSAKREEPERYGSTDEETFFELMEMFRYVNLFRLEPSELEKIRLLQIERNRIIEKSRETLSRLEKEELIHLLLGGLYTEEQSDMVKVNAQLALSPVLKEMGVVEEAKHWGDQWCFKEGQGNGKLLDGFTFEAVHWQERQQEAVVNFITKYLVS